jgi:cytochrome c
MNHLSISKPLAGAVALGLIFSVNVSVAADIDASAARELARANSCFKCHGVDKDKDGPSYKKVAEKYRGKDEGEEKLIANITTGRKAKFPDGHEEEHKIIDTRDMDKIKNLVGWILSL